MNEQLTPEMEAELRKMESQSKHAFEAIVKTQQAMADVGVSGPALCSATATAYISLVAAMCASIGAPKESVIGYCKEALDTLSEQVDLVYGNILAEKAAQAEGK